MSYIGRFIASTSGWAVVLCLLGASTIAMPWRLYALLPAFQPEWRGLPATATWHGVVVPTIYGVTCLVLIATFSTEWVPVWKPLLLVLAGAGGTVCSAMYGLQSNETLIEVFNRRMPAGARVTALVEDYHMLGPGFYVGCGVGVALLLLAALQIRGILFRSPVSAGPREFPLPERAPGQAER